jgi:DNA-binding CsgD family transcriptional regulator
MIHAVACVLAAVKLHEKDVRDMVRLVGEVAALPGGHAGKKRFLMEGLAKLIDADAWCWALSCQREPSKPQVYVSLLSGGFSDESLVKVLEAIEHPDMIPVASKFFLEVEREKTHLTRLRFQITDRMQFMHSGAHAAWKAANVGPTILSLRPVDERSSSVIALYRHYDREEFSPRHSRMAHIILSEVPWLHEQGWPEDRGVHVPSLSRRQRLALNLLILGRSRKQIADSMEISVNTVQGYAKDVYRFFNINSQAELMSRFLQGNGKDEI